MFLPVTPPPKMDEGIHGWGHILRSKRQDGNQPSSRSVWCAEDNSEGLSGRVVQGADPGPTPYLSIEEAELIQHLLTSANIGYPKTKNEVLAIVQQAVHKKRGVEAAESFNGKGWWNRFVQRWPKICLRKGDALATPSRHKNQHHPILRSSEEDAR